MSTTTTCYLLFLNKLMQSSHYLNFSKICNYISHPFLCVKHISVEHYSHVIWNKQNDLNKKQSKKKPSSREKGTPEISQKRTINYFLHRHHSRNLEVGLSRNLEVGLSNFLMKFTGDSYICEVRSVLKMGLKR